MSGCPCCGANVAPNVLHISGPCFGPVQRAGDGELITVCHRRANHTGVCSDWAPNECTVPDCACTEEEAEL
jgi:hypothetical protein